MTAPPPPPTPPPPRSKATAPPVPRVGKKKQAPPSFLRRAFFSPSALLFAVPMSAERRMAEMERLIDEQVAAAAVAVKTTDATPDD